ncbi:MAG: 3-oxoacyl-[acyl-carrier-protein] synthase III C-terminal domain-containing protein [Candidatus Algichlamydia australiensis]|nr:3-oxoacyl-[acyl-carrier-protein] synthase III C-terminal domain-containing protein [Chlamydiales bacterium]
MNKEINIELIGVGKYLPSRKVAASGIDNTLKTKLGWSLNATGVKYRFFSDGETSSEMGAKAINEAIKNTNISKFDFDALVSVGGTTQQPIPCTASLIAAQLGLRKGLIAFDVNATCLGFLVALDLLAKQISLGCYNRVALVASEIASEGLNWQQKESAALFGDGAAAVIIGPGKKGGSKIIASHFETYSEGVEFCQIRGGSAKLHAKYHSKENSSEYLFDMHGSSLFKLVMKKLPSFLKDLLAQANLALSDIDLVIPHQASLSALTLLRKRLGLSEKKFFINVHEHGNIISASIPLALHDALNQDRIQRGNKVLLLGSSAGVSLGGVVLEY